MWMVNGLVVLAIRHLSALDSGTKTASYGRRSKHLPNAFYDACRVTSRRSSYTAGESETSSGG